jgi:hypothetical protein
MAKKTSGAQRRKQQKQGVKPNKIGRPPSSVKAHLRLDLAHRLWTKDPDWPYWPDWPRDRCTVSFLLSRHRDFERHRLICTLRKYDDEKWYANLSDKTLSRYIGELLPSIWGLRRR